MDKDYEKAMYYNPRMPSITDRLENLEREVEKIKKKLKLMRFKNGN